MLKVAIIDILSRLTNGAIEERVRESYSNENDDEEQREVPGVSRQHAQRVGPRSD